MIITKIEINNFKGIRHTVLKLNKAPKGNIYTLVGINESGKTSILEAINAFTYNSEGRITAVNDVASLDPEKIIPIKDKANFNGEVEITTTLEISDTEKEDLKNYAKEIDLKLTTVPDEIEITQIYQYKNSNFQNNEVVWSADFKGKHGKQKKEHPVEGEEWEALTSHLQEQMPRILYFPTALFDLPDKIHLDGTTDKKDLFYKEIIQDVLDSMNKDMTVQEHIVARQKAPKGNDKESLKQLALEIGREITNTILGNWSDVLSNKKYKVNVDVDSDSIGTFISFKIETDDGYCKLSERSLGFRWFFVFLLLTQYMGFRKSDDRHLIFLFDEPAANLSRKAQKQLLDSLKHISDKCTIIYTTHSQHLINPDWLENAFVVSNSALEVEYDDNVALLTDITVERYREYVNENPQQTSYFQPILDVLEYAPSNLEMCSDVVILEGKNDYYTLNYFFKNLLKNNDVMLIPGMNCENAGTLAALYFGWGKKCIVLLDSDMAGEQSKEKYISMFGPLVIGKIFTLGDIKQEWQGKSMEQLFKSEDILKLQRACFPDSENYSKNLFNKSIQELLMTNKTVEVSSELINEFRGIHDFLKERISE